MLLYEHLRAIINDSKKAILEESTERLPFIEEDFQKIIDNITVRIGVSGFGRPRHVDRQAAAKEAGIFSSW